MSIFSDLTDSVLGSSGFFTGGLTGANAFLGNFNPSTIGLDAAGLGLGAGIAGSGLASGGLNDVLGTLGLDLPGVIKDQLGLNNFSLPGSPDASQVLGAVPVLAAIAYARSQGPFDTSRLQNIYSHFDPNALASEYDINTGRGQNALTSSLMQRGVLGSSFGNADLTNFNTSRELGRNALVNQGYGVAGGIANDILGADIKQRALQNDLYGRSLLALGNIFGGQNRPTISPAPAPQPSTKDKLLGGLVDNIFGGFGF